MTLTRILITAFATAIASGAHAAGPEHELCRIWTCTIASPTATASLVPEPHPAAVTVGAQNLPVTDRTTVAPSTDGQLYACVGYDPFGDAELMCLLVP